MGIYEQLPPEAVKIVLVLFLSFLIGLEREEHKGVAGNYAFGGVRTFPLIGLIGYSMALISGAQLAAADVRLSGRRRLSAAFVLAQAHADGHGGRHHRDVRAGDISGWRAGLLRAFLDRNHAERRQPAAAGSEDRSRKLAAHIAAREILTFAKFLFLSAVILPVLPNQAFGPFHINPFKTWLVVVAISAISYASYVLQKLTKGQGGIVLAALLGGAYSSTVTTVVMARQGKLREPAASVRGRHPDGLRSDVCAAGRSCWRSSTGN